ncbi:hypothetical protein BUALT_Bualt05G0009100 [Buddleja alternifolia]|uniref:Protein CLP1 homolog n=1 Tax=Buddleja alternifolia TaxID=168488 RepID=A0AAV6XNG2_9LAMI|nr:hypothetical protein BUALT_Bualt05G0009100 [Buddleja alternifolia]
MAYGGAAVAQTAPPGGSTTVRQVKLDKECELRVEVSSDSPLRLRLLNGTAEIYGTEVPPGIWLSFPPMLKFADFTWYGATIEMDGTAETDYTADETPMISYVNVHAVLDARRNRAKASPSDSDMSQGPRVIVVGPTDSGKSTLSRMLLSWAAKQGWKPTFVDLDIGQGSITIPGCIAATPVELPIDPVEGIPLDMPLVYFHGHVTPGPSSLNCMFLHPFNLVLFSGNVDLYKVLVKELAQVLDKQFAGNVESRASGMVINTMGWIEGVGYELLLHAIHTLNATVVLVLGQEKLWSMLKDVLKNKTDVDVVKLQKSGGVVSRNAKARQRARSLKIREYFYGLANDLSPHSNTANFSDLCIYRVGGGPQAPRSALPVGAEPSADPTRLTPVSVNQDLLHLVLAVSYAKEPDEIISSNVAGFIWISDINFESKKITYLAPSAGNLPGKYLIMGSLTCDASTFPVKCDLYHGSENPGLQFGCAGVEGLTFW